MSAASSSNARTMVGRVVASNRGQTDVNDADSKNFCMSGRGRAVPASVPACPAATTVARKSTLSTRPHPIGLGE
jgi:hypothetical protein